MWSTDLEKSKKRKALRYFLGLLSKVRVKSWGREESCPEGLKDSELKSNYLQSPDCIVETLEALRMQGLRLTSILRQDLNSGRPRRSQISNPRIPKPQGGQGNLWNGRGHFEIAGLQKSIRKAERDVHVGMFSLERRERRAVATVLRICPDFCANAPIAERTELCETAAALSVDNLPAI